MHLWLKYPSHHKLTRVKRPSTRPRRPSQKPLRLVKASLFWGGLCSSVHLLHVVSGRNADTFDRKPDASQDSLSLHFSARERTAWFTSDYATLLSIPVQATERRRSIECWSRSMRVTHVSDEVLHVHVKWRCLVRLSLMLLVRYHSSVLFSWE